MIKSIYISLWGAAAILFAGCDYTDALLNDGELISKDIQVEAFDHVILDTSVYLVLDNDSSHSVSVEALDFLLPRLKISQNDNVLTIESVGLIGFRQKQMPVVTISSPDLNHIRSNFPVQISNLDTLKIENLRIVISGRGSFTECNLTVDAGNISLGAYGSNVGNHVFKGKAKSLNIVALGLTSVDASQLNAEEVSYRQGSVNQGFVRATRKLTVEMLSSGNLYYSGNPADTIVKFGETLYEVSMGNVIQLQD